MIRIERKIQISKKGVAAYTVALSTLVGRIIVAPLSQQLPLRIVASQSLEKKSHWRLRDPLKLSAYIYIEVFGRTLHAQIGRHFAGHVGQGYGLHDDGPGQMKSHSGPASIKSEAWTRRKPSSNHIHRRISAEVQTQKTSDNIGTINRVCLHINDPGTQLLRSIVYARLAQRRGFGFRSRLGTFGGAIGTHHLLLQIVNVVHQMSNLPLKQSVHIGTYIPVIAHSRSYSLRFPSKAIELARALSYFAVYLLLTQDVLRESYWAGVSARRD